MQKFRYKYLITTLLGALLFWLVYHFTKNQLEYSLSDISAHLYIIIPTLNGAYSFSGFSSVPHFLWHISVIGVYSLFHLPLEAAAIYTTCLYALLSYGISIWVFSKIERCYQLPESYLTSGLLAFLLTIVQPIYAPFFDSTSQYLGQYSPNPLHSPTYMCLRPISILCFCCIYDLVKKAEEPSHKGLFFSLEGGTKKPAILLTVGLLLSCLAKPTFAEMIIPTVALYMLFHWIYCLCKKTKEEAGTYFKSCLRMLCISIPSLLYIGLQFTLYFLMGGSIGSNPENGSVVFTKPFQVWLLHTDNVAFSIILAMAFPLFMLFINREFFLKHTLGKLALLGYVISLLEAALLGEAGMKIKDGNFLWPMMSGMLLFWLVSFIRLKYLTELNCNTKAKQILLQIAWLLVILYGLSGIRYGLLG